MKKTKQKQKTACYSTQYTI